ncbi:MAG: M14 family metallopeptidase [candidate division KSB1 bacterium]|nr:M14 family metallopeptidase [candidate division KSB1 bacterium]
MKQKKVSCWWSWLLLVLFWCSYSSPSLSQVASEIPTPEQHFGFKPGTDRMLFNYEELISYLQKLDAASPRLKMMEIGHSPLGRTMYVALFSSEENISRIDRLKEINRQLALNPDLSETERNQMFAEGRVFLLATLSMHSDEVGPTQSAPLIAHQLVTTTDPGILAWLQNVVYMMVPNHNPDGMDLVVQNYRQYKGTKYEGCSLPGVYHKYIGHDNNRDFVTLTQEDTRAISRIYSLEWFPQVMIEKHQMGSTGVRYFVPPSHDPIAENVDAGIWNWTKIFGANMIADMTEQGLAGVTHSNIFDDYWPGSTTTGIWKNVIGMLTEMASIKDATPIYVEPNELRVGGKGLSEYKKSINMPLPWPGGWWRLSDMVTYEIASTMSLLKTASLHRSEILQFRNDLCRREVQKGITTPPYYFVLPAAQHDVSEWVELANLMQEHGVNVFRMGEDFAFANYSFKKGDLVVPLAQPFRSFIKEVMEKQIYPVRHYTPGGEVIKPYDVTSWSLPLHRGLQAVEVNARSEQFESLFHRLTGDFVLQPVLPGTMAAAVFNCNHNESFEAAFEALKRGLRIERLSSALKIEGVAMPKGSFIIYNSPGNALRDLVQKMKVAPLVLKETITVESAPVVMPRIALVESFFHDMDAGWTRYIFDSYGVPFTVIHPRDFEKADLVKNYDIVIFPDEDKNILMEGKYKAREEYYVTDYPPEFTKGIGKKGLENIMTFLDKGGLIISWGRSTALFTGNLEIVRGKDDREEFQLPVRDLTEQVQKAGLFCPNALLKTILLEDHPLTWGLPKEIGIMFEGRPVFSTSIPIFDMDRRVIGKFPEQNILMSGYCEKEEALGNKSNLVWIRKGKGQLVLFAFNPQFRASTQATYKLLFNSLLLPKIN